MKVVVAVDSFKGSMTSMEAGMAVKAGILAAKKDAEVIVKPLADGGEGTTDALIEGLKGERVDVTVTGPYHEPVQAYYGYLRESNTAVMEMATAAGITLSDKKEPMTATTYGVGELILHFRNELLIMGLQNPAISQRVAIIEHFLVVHAAEAGFVGGLPGIAFHIGCAGAENIVHDILLHISFDKAEGTFVLRIHGIVERDGV